MAIGFLLVRVFTACGPHPLELPPPPTKPPYEELLTYPTAPGSGISSRTRSGEPFQVAVYVPYVEEVLLPKSVYADEPFEIVLRVSANYRPAVLNGESVARVADVDASVRGRAREFGLFRGVSEVQIPYDWNVHLATRIVMPKGYGDPIDKYRFSIEHGLPAGIARIVYYTARDAGHGGIGWFYHDKVGPIPGDPVEWIEKYVEKREIIIEVLPRETGSSS